MNLQKVGGYYFLTTLYIFSTAPLTRKNHLECRLSNLIQEARIACRSWSASTNEHLDKHDFTWPNR
jgi:hypothetical protein